MVGIGGMVMKSAFLSKNRKLFFRLMVVVVVLGILTPCEARHGRGKARRIPVTKGKPGETFSGTIESVDTTGVWTITVNGSSSSKKTNGGTSGSGAVKFQVDPLTTIKTVTGSMGTIKDLQVGEHVSISYIHGLGDIKDAKSITLGGQGSGTKNKSAQKRH